jgi:hypothetical protein
MSPLAAVVACGPANSGKLNSEPLRQNPDPDWPKNAHLWFAIGPQIRQII